MVSIDAVMETVRRSWRPPPKLSLSDWSDRYAFLSAESSAQEGKWRTLPYQKPIMDAMTDPTVETIVVKKSARVGYTKMLNNLIGYHIHQDPCSILLVQPTIEDAEGYSKEEIDPMIRDTPVINGIVSDIKSKDKKNTILAKSYPGGVLSMVGANSPRGFRRVSRRIICLDEVSGYPVGGAGSEGDQVKLASRRSEYYWNRKIVAGSTPTNKGSCRISSMYEDSDKRQFFVPCPHCGEYQVLKWGDKDSPYGLKWPEGKPREAFYVCEHNGCCIEHHQKFEMIEKGEFRATAVSKRPGLVGYHIWAIYSYSPNASWGQLAEEFEDSQGDQLKEKTFTNTVLGLEYEAKADQIDHEGLMLRRESYEANPLPDGVCLVTAGVDWQHDRVEIELVGWGIGEESWSLDYQIIYGDTSKQEIHQYIDAQLTRTFKHQRGHTLRVLRSFVDSGDGTRVQEVYNYTRIRSHMGIYACKGMPGEDRPIAGKPTMQGVDKDVTLFPVGTMPAKDMVFARLKTKEPGRGFWHFPLRYEKEYFEQLTAEKLVTTVNKKGFSLREYHKIRKRNEALDCRVYAYASMYSTNLNLEQIALALAAPPSSDTKSRKIRGSLEQ